MKYEIKLENELFEDLRTMANRQLAYICKQINENGFSEGETVIKVKVEGKSLHDNQDLKVPSIDYKVNSSLKKSLSEDNSLFFTDRVLAQADDGSFYLADWSGNQENMFEEEVWK